MSINLRDEKLAHGSGEPAAASEPNPDPNAQPAAVIPADEPEETTVKGRIEEFAARFRRPVESARDQKSGDRLRGAAIRKPRPVRSGAGEYSGQSAAADGGGDGRPSGPIGAGYSFGVAAASSPKRDRGLPRARAGSAAASPNRRLEQPSDAQRGMKIFSPAAAVRGGR